MENQVQRLEERLLGILKPAEKNQEYHEIKEIYVLKVYENLSKWSIITLYPVFVALFLISRVRQ